MFYLFNESISSQLSKDFKPKDKLSLSLFTKLGLDDGTIKKYKDKNRFLSHMRTNSDYKGYIFIDKEKVVAVINVNISNGIIQAMEITSSYQGHGLSLQLLDLAVKNLKATELSVNRSNAVAISIYKKYGFKVIKETDIMYFMRIGNSKH